MVNVRMLIHRTGGRFDGQEWPPYLGEIDVPQWEADDLIKHGTAEHVNAPVLDRGFDVLKVPALDYESHLKRADGSIAENEEEEPSAISDSDLGDFDDDDSDFDNDFDIVDGDNEVAVTPQVKRPSTVDNKAAWIAYAVSKGADPEKASAKTKAMLIADY